ncbi:MAG: magnesium transporter [Rubellimicrobium sp.]|nr:magnesium transporter [Rubellimicrobium sp.]
MTTATLSAPDIRPQLSSDDRPAIAARLAHEHTADIAALLGDLSAEEGARVLLALPDPRQADLFGYLPPDLQSRMAHVLDRAEMARIFGAMAHDERADLVDHLTEAQRAALLPGLAQAEREDVRRLSAYPDGTVGSVMTSDYATIPPDLTTVQAVAHLRLVAPDAETIYTFLCAR